MISASAVSDAGIVTPIQTLCGSVTSAEPSTLVNSTTSGMKLVLQDDGDVNIPSFTAYVYVLPTFKGEICIYKKSITTDDNQVNLLHFNEVISYSENDIAETFGAYSTTEMS